MTLRIYTLLIFVILYHNSHAQVNHADDLLRQVSDKLNSLSSIRYDLTREMDYTTRDYHVTVDWSCYFNFSEPHAPLFFSYQVESSSGMLIYNGTEKFNLKESEKTIELYENPQKKDFEGLSFLYNSLITLKNVLPILIDDKDALKAVSDTVLHEKPMQVVTVNIGKRRIQNLGDAFDIMQTPYNLIYKIVVDPETHLPAEIIQINDADKDYIKTSFTNIDVNPAPPAPDSWFYSTYTDEYSPAEAEERPVPLPVGSSAPDWKLSYFDQLGELSLGDLTGKVVLIEFWIKNCSYCIASVPYLNQLQELFRDKDVVLISLNAYDPMEDIAAFVDKYNVNYPVLLNASEVATQYGVFAYPSLFIIDKSGTIIHSNGSLTKSNISAIEKLIEKAL